MYRMVPLAMANARVLRCCCCSQTRNIGAQMLRQAGIRLQCEQISTKQEQLYTEPCALFNARLPVGNWRRPRERTSCSILGNVSQSAQLISSVTQRDGGCCSAEAAEEGRSTNSRTPPLLNCTKLFFESPTIANS